VNAYIPPKNRINTIQLKTPSHHFSERLKERFSKDIVDLSQFEIVTPFSQNRYEHPRVMKYFNKRRDCKYLVSKLDNMIIPTTFRGVMLTALYYK
jgi:hypothetical protein